VSDQSNATNNDARKAWIRALQATASIGDDPMLTLPRAVERQAEAAPDSLALLCDHSTMTYRELAARLRAYSNWALRHHVGPGDVVGLLMSNSPEYLATWLGITRVGGVVALLNAHQTGEGLAHAINITTPKHLIVGAGLAEAAEAVRPRLGSPPVLWSHGEDRPGWHRIDREIAATEQPDGDAAEHAAPTIANRAVCIYTSGTTGLPKAANVSHFRVMQWSCWFAGMMDARPSDRMYNCLPMYHSVGGVVGIGPALVNGASVVVREGFSASRFWDDVVQSKCTIFQYIGELCRYLVNTPPSTRESQHQLRLACGNGLSAAVWEKFQTRFRIPQILEFYASTEGNVSLFNTEGRVGSLGRIPSFMPQRSMVALIKIDDATNEPIRNSDGFCIRCSANEVGEAIGQIQSDGMTRFEGYTDKAASEKKILRNAFASADAWFRTGDLMRKDAEGFYYFVDRAGDTFRWKGENVSTTEVAGTISAYAGVLETVVYGVTIPGNEGRAGMAAVVAREDFDLAAFHRHLVQELPEYARPLFLRILKTIEATGTFKPKKMDLVRDSYDPSTTADAIYFNDSRQQAFVKVDSDLLEKIQSGMMRL
jgi:fatty-acyl-CoA synthase